ncbi:hypothetical protein GGU11DRAFT_561301 [Lentinula aff. detonsa]|nr:hypothetical protein GGU11DRAFT_561301 [Lentinula aff. detonsa]
MLFVFTFRLISTLTKSSKSILATLVSLNECASVKIHQVALIQVHLLIIHLLLLNSFFHQDHLHSSQAYLHSHRVRLRLHQDHHCIRCPCITHPSPLHPFLVDSVTIMRTGHTHCMEHLVSNSHYSLNGMLHTEHIVVNTTIDATYQ